MISQRMTLAALLSALVSISWLPHDARAGSEKLTGTEPGATDNSHLRGNTSSRDNSDLERDLRARPDTRQLTGTEPGASDTSHLNQYDANRRYMRRREEPSGGYDGLTGTEPGATDESHLDLD